MKFRTLIIAALFIVTIIFPLAGCAAHQYIELDHGPLGGPQLAAQVSQQTVALVTDFNRQDTSHRAYCSAVWVGHKSILTANHCVEGYAQMLYRTNVIQALVQAGLPPMFAQVLVQKGITRLDPSDPDMPDELRQLVVVARSVPHVSPHNLVLTFIVQNEVTDIGTAPTDIHHAQAIAADLGSDLSLLQVLDTIPAHQIAQLADKTPEVGSTIAVVGHPRGAFWMYRQGLVSAYRHNLSEIEGDEDSPTKLHGPWLQISAPITHGDSGGGVFDQQGYLVGINLLASEELPGGYCTHLDNIRAFLAGQHLVALKLKTKAQDPQL